MDDTGTQLLEAAMTWTDANTWSMTPLSVPDAPSGVTAASTSPTQVTVSWTAPNANGAPITSYTATSSSTSYPVLGPVNVATAASTTSLMVSWSAPTLGVGQVVVGYTVTLKSGTKTLSCATTLTFCTFSGLTASTTYAESVSAAVASQCQTTALSCVLSVPSGSPYGFSVTATNAAGTSVGSVMTQPITPTSSPQAPLPVTGVTVLPSITSAAVSWTAPSATFGSTIVSYTVTASASIGDTRTHQCTTASTGCTVTGLIPGITYVFAVYATNATGNSVTIKSAPATAGITTIQAPVAPSAPTAVSATMTAPTVAVISWTAPSVTGGSPVTNYLVTSTPGRLQCNTSTTTCTIANLTPNQSYTFNVVAYNAAGPGAAGVSGSVVAGSASSTAPIIVPTNTMSFFNGPAVPLQGTITCCTVSGSTWSSASSFTATPGDVTFGGFTMSNIHMSWTPAGGWTGTATVSLGGSSLALAGTIAYTDANSWVFTATSSSGSVRVAPGISSPFVGVSGTMTDSYGSITWALSATLGNVVLVPGILTLSSISISVLNSCPTLTDGTAVCPNGANGLYVELSGTLAVTIASTSISASALLVYGVNSDTMALGASLGDIALGSAASITSADLVARFSTSLSAASGVTTSLSTGVGTFVSTPGAPNNVSGAPVGPTGITTVIWTPPTSDGGTPILGYTATAYPATGSPAADLPQSCTYAVPLAGKAINTCTIYGLDPTAAYTYVVTATNGLGMGQAGVSHNYGSVTLGNGSATNQLTVEVSGSLSIPTIGFTATVVLSVTSLANCGFEGTGNTSCLPGAAGSSSSGTTSGSTTATAVCQTGVAPIDGACPLFGWAIIAQAGASAFGVPGFAAGAMGYVSTDTLATYLGQSYELAPNTFFFVGTFNMPAAVTKVTGLASVQAWVQYSPATDSWKLQVAIGSGWVVKIGSVSIDFVQTDVTIAGTGVVPTEFAFDETGIVTFSNPNGTTQSIAATLAGAYQDGGVVAQISLTGATPGADAWDNMMGYQGFNLVSATMAISFVDGSPALGFSATATLPQTLMKDIGGDGSAIISVSGNISYSTPCFAFSLTSADGRSNVLNIGEGSITAKSVTFEIAPLGCQIGIIGEPGSVTMPPGLSLAFQATFVGVPVSASINVVLPTPASGSIPAQLYTTMSGSITVGAFNLGALHVGAGSIAVSVSDAPGFTESFSYSASATLFGVTLAASESVQYTLGTLSGSIAVSGSLNNATIGGFGVKQFAFSFAAGDVGTVQLSASLSLIIALGDSGAGVAVSGSIGPTGATLTGTAALKLGGFSVSNALTVTLSTTSSGSSFSATDAESLTLWGTQLTGTASIYVGSDGQLAMTQTFSASLALAGWTFAGMTVTEILHGSTYTWTIAGNLAMFNHALTGSVSGSLRAASDGTILLYLTANLTVNISGFQGSASLKMGNCTDVTCSAFTPEFISADFSVSIAGTSINVDSGWQTLSTAGLSIQVSQAVNQTSGIAYACSNCSTPSTKGLKRYEASFAGQINITITDSSCSFAAGFKASIQSSTSTGSVTHPNWGSFSTLTSVSASLDSHGKMTASYLGFDMTVQL